MVGGATTLAGPLVSALIFSLLTSSCVSLSYVYLIVLGALLIALVVYLPNGLVSIVTRRRVRGGGAWLTRCWPRAASPYGSAA